MEKGHHPSLSRHAVSVHSLKNACISDIPCSWYYYIGVMSWSTFFQKPVLGWPLHPVPGRPLEPRSLDGTTSGWAWVGRESGSWSNKAVSLIKDSQRWEESRTERKSIKQSDTLPLCQNAPNRSITTIGVMEPGYKGFCYQRTQTTSAPTIKWSLSNRNNSIEWQWWFHNKRSCRSFKAIAWKTELEAVCSTFVGPQVLFLQLWQLQPYALEPSFLLLALISQNGPGSHTHLQATHICSP